MRMTPVNRVDPIPDNMIRVDNRKNLRRVDIDSCTNCEFAFEDYELYCMLAYTHVDDRVCENLASYLSFDGVSDLTICDSHKRKVNEPTV